MSARGRLVAVAAALLLPGWLLAAWVRAGTVGGGPIAPVSLPRQLGPWAATEESRLEPEVLDMIAPDAHLLRLYEAPGRSPVWIYLGLYTGRGSYRKAAHDPEVCYPAQGWEVLGSHTVEIDVAEPGSPGLRAKLLDAHRGLERETVLYWFQPASRWPASGALEEILRIVDAVRGTPQYAFVRLSAPSENRPTAQDLLEFAGLLAPSVRDAVQILHPPSPGS